MDELCSSDGDFHIGGHTCNDNEICKPDGESFRCESCPNGTRLTDGQCKDRFPLLTISYAEVNGSHTNNLSGEGTYQLPIKMNVSI